MSKNGNQCLMSTVRCFSGKQTSMTCILILHTRSARCADSMSTRKHNICTARDSVRTYRCRHRGFSSTDCLNNLFVQSFSTKTAIERTITIDVEQDREITRWVCLFVLFSKSKFVTIGRKRMVLIKTNSNTSDTHTHTRHYYIDGSITIVERRK